MRIVEYRIPMPMTMDEYRRGQLYAVAKASNQETEGDSGVEVLVNEPYEKGEYTGQYTKKIYHLGSKIPGWLAAIAPASALKLFEESWNGFPHIKTDLQSPFMGARFTYTVETLHFDNDKGEQENVHNLDKKQLKIREVKHIDIVDPVPDGADTSTFHSEVTERGPLRRGWQDEVKPMMCCYKLVTVNFKYFGLQTKVESALIDYQDGLFARFHQQLFCWIDEWYNLSMEELREYENKLAEETLSKLEKEEEETK